MANNSRKRTFTKLANDDDYKDLDMNGNPNKKHTNYVAKNSDDIPFEFNDTIDEFEDEIIIKPNNDDDDDGFEFNSNEAIISTNINNNNNNNNNNNDINECKLDRIKDSCLELVWSEDEFMEDVMSEDGNNINDDNNNDIQIWPPNMKPKNNNVKFEYNNNAYNILHQFNMKWPCLSFDIINDKLGLIRNTIPHTMYLVTGTQADSNGINTINVLKLSQLQKTKYDGDNNDDNELNDNEYNNITDDDPLLQNRQVIHNKTVNRIRSNKKYPNFIATFSEDCNVYIYDLKEHLLSLDGESNKIELLSNKNSIINKPIFTMANNDEGYGIEWSSKELKLLSGSCVGELCLIELQSNSKFKRTIKFKTPKYSIEDIKFSPFESNIFATCGTDKCIKLWDTRIESKRNTIKICKNAHNNDINVISWNTFDSFLMLSGSDDNSFKVWDIRKFVNCVKNKKLKNKKIKPYAYYKYHNKPITSIEWSPFEKSSLIVSSEDNQLSIWDLSLENDDTNNNTNNNNNNNNNLGNLPPQLIFTHCGQEDIKEIHYHPQIPNMIVSSGLSGFHIIQPDNLVNSFNNLSI